MAQARVIVTSAISEGIAMDATQSGSGFPEIRVPTALTFAALVLGFLAGTMLQGTVVLEPLLAFAEPAGKL